MKKITKVLFMLSLLILGSCNLSDKPERPEYVKIVPETSRIGNNEIIINDILSTTKFELDGVTYYWVCNPHLYRLYESHIVCPARDKAIINSKTN